MDGLGSCTNLALIAVALLLLEHLALEGLACLGVPLDAAAELMGDYRRSRPGFREEIVRDLVLTGLELDCLTESLAAAGAAKKSGRRVYKISVYGRVHVGG